MKMNIPKLKAHMKRQGLKIRTLASAIGVTERAIYWVIANERTSWQTLEKIAGALHLDGKDLLK